MESRLYHECLFTRKLNACSTSIGNSIKTKLVALSSGDLTKEKIFSRLSSGLFIARSH